ncbi:HEAT repeat domain-containing protein [Streptomyces sp. NPDC059909]|uniref:HEAT repeat domain-containing protein n=1 Tax=Streptomyces sp. NPDC059909 TaxID=3346998 RepID=UPI003651980B
MRAAAADSLHELVETLLPEPALREPLVAALFDSDDPAVRTAALSTGCPAGLAAEAVEALGDPAWQVRAGAATALRAAASGLAVPTLAKALGDPDADVRKAAVLSLLRHDHADARAALATATSDPDADVRAYAARSVTSARPA